MLRCVSKYSKIEVVNEFISEMFWQIHIRIKTDRPDKIFTLEVKVVDLLGFRLKFYFIRH